MRVIKALLISIAFYGIVGFNYTYAQDIKSNTGHVNRGSFKYYYLQPQSPVKGILILLPGAGDKPKSVFNKTRLPELMAAKGYLTVIPEIHTLLYADDYSLNLLDELLGNEFKAYNAADVILGGFSSGGAIATRYAEYILAKGTATRLKGLVVIDPPLDLQRIYASSERKINNCDGLIKREGTINKAQLENAFGGAPDQQLQQYINHSSYTATATDGGNAKYLKNLPIRFYSEPDLDYVRTTYCKQLQFEDINASDLESLSAFLKRSGNSHCEYITTKGKGFHSWNIMDASNCALWIENISTF